MRKHYEKPPEGTTFTTFLLRLIGVAVVVYVLLVAWYLLGGAR